jgi:hypothetical protein
VRRRGKWGPFEEVKELWGEAGRLKTVPSERVVNDQIATLRYNFRSIVNQQNETKAFRGVNKSEASPKLCVG